MQAIEFLTDKFFSFVNAERRPSLEEVVTEAVALKGIYSAEPVYYTGTLENLSSFINKNPISLQQIELLISKLVTWGQDQLIPVLGLKNFLRRLKNKNELKLQFIFYQSGKLLLERLLISLEDEHIGLLQKKAVFSQLLATDGLEGCSVNCELLVSNAVTQLKQSKEAKFSLREKIRNYVTQIANEVAASTDFALPNSYQKMICDLNHLPYATHEKTASHIFLMYAKELGFPVNVAKDIHALQLKSLLDNRLFNYDQLNHDFIAALKKRLTAEALIDYLSKEYYYSFTYMLQNEVFKTHQEKMQVIVNELAVIGEDDQFTLHTLLTIEGELKPIGHLSVSILRRFVTSNWLPPLTENQVKLKGETFSFFTLHHRPNLSWLSWQEQGEEQLCLLKDWVKGIPHAAKVLDTRHTLLLQLFINNPELLDRFVSDPMLLQTIEFSTSLAVTLKNAAQKFCLQETNIVLLVDVLFSLPNELQLQIFTELPKWKKRDLLKRAFLRAHIAKRYMPKMHQLQVANFLEQFYAKSISESYRHSLLQLTHELIKKLLASDFTDFERFVFPKLFGVKYLDQLTFSLTSFKDSIFYTPMKNVEFKQVNLDAAIIYSELNTILFKECNLVDTHFLPSLPQVKDWYQDVILLNCKLSEQGYHGLLLGNTNLKYSIPTGHARNYETLHRYKQQKQQAQLAIAKAILQHIQRLSQAEINSLLHRINLYGPRELWPILAPHIETPLFQQLVEIYGLRLQNGNIQENERTYFNFLVKRYITWHFQDHIYPLILNSKIEVNYQYLSNYLVKAFKCFKTKRELNSPCSAETVQNLLEPSLFTWEEQQALSYMLKGSADATQRQQLFTAIKHIDEIRKEKFSHRSQREAEQLIFFKKITDNLILHKEKFLKKITKQITPETIIEVKLKNLSSIFLFIEVKEKSNLLQIYCPHLRINTFLTFQMFPNESDQLVQSIVNILSPQVSTEDCQIVYHSLYKQNIKFQRYLTRFLHQDFRADRTILLTKNNEIEGLSLKKVQALFLINGDAPALQQLHTHSFSDAAQVIHIRAEKLVTALWRSTSQEQIALGQLLLKYNVPLAIDKTVIHGQFQEKHIIVQFYEKLYRMFKQTIREGKVLTNKVLTRLSQEALDLLLNEKGFKASHIKKTLTGLSQLHQHFSQAIMQLTHVSRQSIALAPPLIQAFNGDEKSLQTLLTITLGDHSLDQIYQSLVKHPVFMQRFPKTVGYLSNAFRFTASPLNKVLLLSNFAELYQDLQVHPAGSPEYQLAESLLIDNTVLLGSLLIEMVGLELGPLGILLDLGITAHQLISSADFMRKKIPFRVSYWKALLLSLNFKQDWLEAKLHEQDIFAQQLSEIKQLEKRVGVYFSYLLARLPELTKVDLTSLALSTCVRKVYPFLSVPVLYYCIKREKELQNKEKQFAIKMSTMNAILTEVNGTIRQENTFFNRVKQTQLYPHWQIQTTTQTSDGDAFSTNNILLHGGLSALLKKKEDLPSNVSLELSNFIVFFEPCFGNMNITGGTFLQGKSLYMLIQTLDLESFPGGFPVHSPNFSYLQLSNTQSYLDEVVVFVGANTHRSTIDVNAFSLVIYVLPIIGFEQFKPFFTLVTITQGVLQFGSDQVNIGPRFINLQSKREVILNFALDYARDYRLAGPIYLEQVKDMTFIAIQSSATEVPHFFIRKEQSLLVSLFSGMSSYSIANDYPYNTTYCFQLKVQRLATNAHLDEEVGPQLLKLPQKSFVVNLHQSLNKAKFTDMKNGTLLISLQKPDIAFQLKYFLNDPPFTIEGFYLSQQFSRIASRHLINNRNRQLELLDVPDFTALLQDKQFFADIARQGYARIVLKDSLRFLQGAIVYQQETQTLTYAGLTYIFDDQLGLVAQKGILNTTSQEEDFSTSVSLMLDVQTPSNTSFFPLRMSETSIILGERKLINLKPNLQLLTARGLLPLHLLPLASQVALQCGPIDTISTSKPSTQHRKKRNLSNKHLKKDFFNLFQSFPRFYFSKTYMTVQKPLFFQAYTSLNQSHSLNTYCCCTTQISTP